MSQFKQNNEKEIEDLRTKIKELEMKNANQKFTIGELQRDKKTESMRNCPDCSAKPGHCHSEGCDVEQCSVCGWQRLLCTCEGHDPAFARWSGIWPGKAEAIALGIDLNEFAKRKYNEIFWVKPKTSRNGEITNSYGLSNALTGMAKHEGWMTDDQWQIGKNDDGSVYCCANKERQIMLPGALVDRIRANYESEEIDKLQRDARNFEGKLVELGKIIAEKETQIAELRTHTAISSLRDEIHQLNHKNEDLVLEKEKLAREKALAEKKYRDRAARTLKLSNDRDEWKASAKGLTRRLNVMNKMVKEKIQIIEELEKFKATHEVVDCDNCNGCNKWIDRILELEKNIAKAQTARAKNVRETQAKVIKLENKVMLFKGRVGTVENYLKNSNAHVEDLKVQLDVARTTIKLVHQVTEEVAQK